MELSKFWFFQVVREPLWRAGTIFVLSMGGLQHAESFLLCIKGSVNIGEQMNHVGFQKKMQRKMMMTKYTAKL